MANPRLHPEEVVLGVGALDWVARVQEFPQPAGITYVERYIPTAGGGGNVAEMLARLGHGVRFLGVLGDDENGLRLYRAFLVIDRANMYQA